MQRRSSAVHFLPCTRAYCAAALAPFCLFLARPFRYPLDTATHMSRACGSLITHRDEAWRLTRLAWQPAFSSASLSGYLPLMVGCARKLVARLEDRAGAGEVEQEHQLEGGKGGSKAGGPHGAHSVDLWRELGRMTLQVVGSTAFG